LTCSFKAEDFRENLTLITISRCLKKSPSTLLQLETNIWIGQSIAADEAGDPTALGVFSF